MAVQVRTMVKTGGPSPKARAGQGSDDVEEQNRVPVTLNEARVKPEEGQGLYESLKLVLLFCKLIGLVPFTSYENSSWRRRSWSG